ncbi:putative phosphoenolpyruvate synthase [Blattamonas nauphoetae]|uniref:Phosphoenolpyruvate synthase n=1 Tax=Blattamonas nauphoetae TaxID=2049346 RepID=A0ABQ9XVW4_9EUKA|nr:putative phosphoenolpyruvate synthase [Blattamonas nauphoetae]
MNLFACDNAHIQYSMMAGRVKRVLFIGNEYDFFQVDSCFMNQGFSTCPDFIWKTHAEVSEFFRNEQKVDVIISMHETNDSQMWEDVRIYREFCPRISIYPICFDIDSNYPIFNVKMKIKAFVWHGDPMLFLALIKLTEDDINLEKDVLEGPSGIILYVEDTCRFYSEYLPHIYEVLLGRTRHLQGFTAKHALARRRARPKVIFKTCLSEALEVLNLCEGKVLAVVSDIEYPLSNKRDGTVGPYTRHLMDMGLFNAADCPHRSGLILRDSVKKVEGINASIFPPPRIPFLFLSTATEHKAEVRRCSNCLFAQKDSGSLLTSLQVFFDRFAHLSPVFFALDPSTGIPYQDLTPAVSLNTLTDLVQTIPDDSLLYHAQCNSFSNWLFNIGEFGIAIFLQHYKTRNFNNEPSKVRSFITNALMKYMYERTQGLAFDFDPFLLNDPQFVMTVGGGGVGGKAHGIMYMDRLITKINEALMNDSEIDETAHIVGLPRTLILGTSIFQTFVHDHHFGHLASPNVDSTKFPDAYIAAAFTSAPLRPDLIEVLHHYVAAITVPIIVRPSSLLEDSSRVPVSGIYSSFFLGNNHPNLEIRLNQLMIAIKLVYASTYFKRARLYRQSSGRTSSSEAMGIILQEVPGQFHTGTQLFYPHATCSCLSVNFYPVKSSKPMKPEDGIGNLVVGLAPSQKTDDDESSGRKPVKQYRFSPGVPEVSYLLEEADFERQTQQYFLAIDLNADQSCTEKFMTTSTQAIAENSTEIDSFDVEVTELTNIQLHQRQTLKRMSQSPQQYVAHPRVSPSLSPTSDSPANQEARPPSNSQPLLSRPPASPRTVFLQEPSLPIISTPLSSMFTSASPAAQMFSPLTVTASPVKYPPFPIDPNINPLLPQNAALFGLPCFLVQKPIDQLRKDNVIQLFGAEYKNFLEGNVRQHYYPGIPEYSQIFITFSKLLNSRHALKLPRIIQHILRVTKEAMKTEVQLTFSINLTKSPFEIHLLELRPAITKDSFSSSTFSGKGTDTRYSSFARFGSFRNLSSQNFVGMRKSQSSLQINMSTAFSFPPSKILCSSKTLVGVPSISPPIFHLVYPDRQKFDILKTEEIAREISTVNDMLGKQGKKFVLIGFGRWGTKQPSLGIPIKWPDIKNASALVETITDTFAPEPSDGSHFLQNMIDAKIPWIYVRGPGEKERKRMNDDYTGDIMNWEWIDERESLGWLSWQGKYVKCLSLSEDSHPNKSLIKGQMHCLRIVVDTLNSRARILIETIVVGHSDKTGPQTTSSPLPWGPKLAKVQVFEHDTPIQIPPTVATLGTGGASSATNDDLLVLSQSTPVPTTVEDVVADCHDELAPIGDDDEDRSPYFVVTGANQSQPKVKSVSDFFDRPQIVLSGSQEIDLESDSDEDFDDDTSALEHSSSFSGTPVPAKHFHLSQEEIDDVDESLDGFNLPLPE